MKSNPADIPFGHFALPRWRENLRLLGARLPQNGVGRRLRSVLRRVVTVGSKEPYDIELYPTVRARVFPTKNICEKRVFAAPELYDQPERRTLTQALHSSNASRFVFIDLGANVGVYTLWLVSEARRLKRQTQVLAVEPDPDTFARLATNLSLSGATEATARQCAVGAREGHGRIIQHLDNRGQHRVELATEETPDASVPVVPLHTLCEEQGIDRIDAIKVDLEGVDEPVLSTFLAHAKETLWPEWMVVEVGKQANAPVVELCIGHGYRLIERTRLNGILHKPAAGKTAS